MEASAVDLCYQLRLAGREGDARAVLEARSPDRRVSTILEASGATEQEAMAALAEQARAFYVAVCGMVETVEDLARVYCEPASDRAGN